MKQLAYIGMLLCCLAGVSYGRHHHHGRSQSVQPQEQRLAMANRWLVEGAADAVEEAEVFSKMRAGLVTRARLATTPALVIGQQAWEQREAQRNAAEQRRRENTLALAEAEQRAKDAKSRESEFYRQAFSLQNHDRQAANIAYQHAMSAGRQRFQAELVAHAIEATVRLDTQDKAREAADRTRELGRAMEERREALNKAIREGKDPLPYLRKEGKSLKDYMESIKERSDANTKAKEADQHHVHDNPGSESWQDRLRELKEKRD